MSTYLLQEDGTSKFTLEDGTGFILLEVSGAVGLVCTKSFYSTIYHPMAMKSEMITVIEGVSPITKEIRLHGNLCW